MTILRAINPSSVDDIPLKPVHEFLLERIRNWLETRDDYVWLEDCASGQNMRLSEVEPSVRKIASWLSKNGFGRGDVMCMHMNNFPHFFSCVLAAWVCGGCITTSNIMSNPDKISRQIEISKTKVLVCDHTTLADCMEATRSVQVKNIIVIGKAGSSGEGVTSLNDILLGDDNDYPSSVKLDLKEDVALLVYSSGTSGLPKGIMHTHYTVMATLNQQHISDEPGLQFLLTPYFFHVSGFVSCMSWVAKGIQLNTLSEYSDELLLKVIQDKKPVVGFLYPHQLTMLSMSPLVDKYDANSLQMCFTTGAALPSDVIKNVKTRFPALKALLKAYAMSECIGITSLMPSLNPGNEALSLAAESREGCIGYPCPFAQIKIVDEVTGEALGPNKNGILHVKSPCVMKGYANNPEETAKVIDKEGWLCTGDIGYYDEDKLVYFVERAKELIKYKSHQIAPASLEAMLIQHPGIKEAGVLGIPDTEGGEIPKAFIVRSSDQSGTNLTAEEVINYAHGRLADYEKLRGGVVFVESIPRNALGKIVRRDLRNM